MHLMKYTLHYFQSLFVTADHDAIYRTVMIPYCIVLFLRNDKSILSYRDISVGQYDISFTSLTVSPPFRVLSLCPRCIRFHFSHAILSIS